MGVVVVRLDALDVEACSDWLWRLGATAIEERYATEHVELVVGFGDDDLALEARSVLSERWPCRFESTGNEADWRDEWMKWIEPLEVAGFVVHAPWHDPAVWADWGDLDAVSIDPGRAFGSGHHPTTRLALAAIRSQLDRGASVLDVGCGTGILSIAAAKAGAGAVTGLDLDYDIIEVAAANAEANGVARTISLTTDPVEHATSRFDFVVANIVIGDLRPLLPALVDRCDGVLIISGFLEEQFEPLLADVDVVVEARSQLDGWGCAVLRPVP
jgi:ribosomal protein L11 methyltransferase